MPFDKSAVDGTEIMPRHDPNLKLFESYVAETASLLRAFARKDALCTAATYSARMLTGTAYTDRRRWSNNASTVAPF